MIGLVCLSTSSVIFLYYTTWALIVPFVDIDHPLQRYFLPRKYAMLIPAVLLVLGVTLVGSFLALVMIRSAQKKVKKD